MSQLADLTAEPIGLKYFVDTHGVGGGCLRLKKSILIFQNFFFPSYWATPGPSVRIII